MSCRTALLGVRSRYPKYINYIDIYMHIYIENYSGSFDFVGVYYNDERVLKKFVFSS